jgi:hypothetical protein
MALAIEGDDMPRPRSRRRVCSCAHEDAAGGGGGGGGGGGVDGGAGSGWAPGDTVSAPGGPPSIGWPGVGVPVFSLPQVPTWTFGFPGATVGGGGGGGGGG